MSLQIITAIGTPAFDASPVALMAHFLFAFVVPERIVILVHVNPAVIRGVSAPVIAAVTMGFEPMFPAVAGEPPLLNAAAAG